MPSGDVVLRYGIEGMTIEERPDSGEGDKGSECGREPVHLQADPA